MQAVKPAMDMQSIRPAVPIQYKMAMQKIVPQEDDKKCQVNMRPVKSKCVLTRHVKKLSLCSQ